MPYHNFGSSCRDISQGKGRTEDRFSRFIPWETEANRGPAGKLSMPFEGHHA